MQLKVITPHQIFMPHNELSDNWRFGLGVYTPFGLRTEWPEGSLPAFVSQKADLKTFFLTPSVAYKINPYLSVGGGIDIVWSNVELVRSISLASRARGTFQSNKGRWDRFWIQSWCPYRNFKQCEFRFYLQTQS